MMYMLHRAVSVVGSQHHQHHQRQVRICFLCFGSNNIQPLPKDPQYFYSESRRQRETMLIHHSFTTTTTTPLSTYRHPTPSLPSIKVAW